MSNEVLQWGRGLSTAEMLAVPPPIVAAHSGFNGAAVFQPRKWPLFPRARGAKTRLQWGRGLSTAEMLGPTSAQAVLEFASMGPRSFNRGNG